VGEGESIATDNLLLEGHIDNSLTRKSRFDLSTLKLKEGKGGPSSLTKRGGEEKKSEEREALIRGTACGNQSVKKRELIQQQGRNCREEAESEGETILNLLQ